MIGVGIPATTTSRGISRVATLADMEPGAVIENGPAFPDVQGGVITTIPTAHAVPQADANGKLDGWVSLAGKANLDMDNLTPAGTAAIAHYSSPSNTRIVGIAVPASLGSFEAPGDGDVTFVGNSTAVGGIVQMIGAGIRSQSTLSQAANNSVCCTIRVSKGTQVQVYYVNVNNLVITFNYNNGAF